MSIDMFEYRFRQELGKLPVFVPNDQRDARVWPKPRSKDGEFPAWRALFSAMCLFGHSTGYRLFSFDEFYDYCKRAYTTRHPEHARFVRYFSGDLEPGMRQRIGAWYESGMAETYLYACLAEAIEDKSKAGLVLYDPRADWKLKADVIVILKNHQVRVSAYVGEHGERQNIEARRDTIERMRKANTSESAHWNNAQIESMPVLEITRLNDDMQIINGIRLFSLRSVNKLLKQIYTHAGIEGYIFSQ